MGGGVEGFQKRSSITGFGFRIPGFGSRNEGFGIRYEDFGMRN